MSIGVLKYFLERLGTVLVRPEPSPIVPQTIDKKKFYFDTKKKTKGQMVTGTLKIGKKTYKFNKSGVYLNP